MKDSKNSSLGNNPWENKRPAYALGCYSEMEISMNDVWNYDTIMARGKGMLDFLGKMIGTEFVVDEGKDDYVDVLLYSKVFVPK